MKPRTSQNKVRNFMGVIKYYRNMLLRWLQTLVPLTRLLSIRLKFRWTQSKQYYFDEIKPILARNSLLTYLDFNETFKIYTDASTLQL